MNRVNDPLIFIRDIKPGLKNLNVVFIVLEIGKWGLQPTPPPAVSPGAGDRGAAAARPGLPSPSFPSPTHVAPVASAGDRILPEAGALGLVTFHLPDVLKYRRRS